MTDRSNRMTQDRIERSLDRVAAWALVVIAATYLAQIGRGLVGGL